MHAQVFNYKIESNGTYIGNLSATKTVKEGITQIKVVSAVKVKLFLFIDFKYILNCSYRNGEMIQSSLVTYVNGKIHSTSNVKKKSNYYNINHEGDNFKRYENIRFSSAMLYFTEPKGIGSIFSEFECVDNSIKGIAPNEYQLKNSKNGSLNTYCYHNGNLESCTINHTLLTFSLSKI